MHEIRCRRSWRRLRFGDSCNLSRNSEKVNWRMRVEESLTKPRMEVAPRLNNHAIMKKAPAVYSQD